MACKSANICLTNTLSPSYNNILKVVPIDTENDQMKVCRIDTHVTNRTQWFCRLLKFS